METFEFTFVVDAADPHADDFEDIFFEAGCDDATLALMHGAVAACFHREASTYKEAVLSAYESILSTGETITRFEPDFLVSASEIASRAGLTRGAVSHYEKGDRGKGFPRPFARVTTKSPLWDWVAVSQWLCLHGKLSEQEYRSAQVSRIINFNVQTGAGFERARGEVEAALREPLPA